jgi:hypothetical protein
VALALGAPVALETRELSQLGALPVALVADVPHGAKPNRDVPGFRSKDGAVRVEVELAGSHDAQSLQDEKSRLELLEPLASLIVGRETSDGWVVTTSHSPSPNRVGPRYRFLVRRTIEGRAYTCYGGVDRMEQLDANVKICVSLRAKGK